MRHALVAALLLSLPVVLAGCGQNGIFRDRGFDYLKAAPGKPLVYPEGLTPLPSRELYPVPAVETRRKFEEDGNRKAKLEIPPPPQLAVIVDAAATVPEAGRVVPEAGVTLTRDGNGYPVLMLDLDFNWAWQEVGDALKAIPSVKVEDIDRGIGVYFLAIDGKRNSAGEPWQLKLNYTANGIQVALQVDENGMAPAELSSPLMQQLKDGIR